VKKINVFLGIAGVNPGESLLAKRIGRIFELLVLAALLVVFAQVFSLYTGGEFESKWLTNLIWLVFFLELVVNLFNVQDKKRYLKENWLNTAIVLIAFPGFEWGSDWVVIVRSLRLLLFVRFFGRFFVDLVAVLNRHRFGQILVASAFIILGSGALFSYLEDRPLWDGVWYSLVTITTVGYGDVVPASEYGKVFGVALILFGVVFFSLVTANISAFLIGSEQKVLEDEILEHMKYTEEKLALQQKLNEEQVERIVSHMSHEITLLKEEIKELHSDLAMKNKD